MYFMKNYSVVFRLTICLLSILYSNLFFSQLTVTTTGFNRIIDCGKADTVTVVMRNTTGTPITINNINISLQANMQFDQAVLNCTQSGGTLSNPVLSFTPDSIIGTQTDSIKFTVKSLCGYTAGAGASPNINITVNTSTPSGSFNSSYSGYSAVQPNVTFTETPSSFSVTPRVDIITRTWTIQQTQPGAYLSRVHVYNQFTDLELVDLSIDGGNTLLPLSNYTLTVSNLMISLSGPILAGTAFVTIGDGDTLFETGETIQITARFKSTGCNMSSQMRAGFSCVANPVTDADFCLIGASNRVSPNFNYTARQVSSKTFQSDAPLQLSCLGTYDTITMAITNTSTDLNVGATMFDVYPFGGYAIRPEAKDSLINAVSLQYFMFDNGFTVSIQDSATYIEPLDSFGFANTDFDGPGGFSDVDGDGVFDDILPGDTAYYHLVIYKRHQCSGSSINLRFNMGVCDYSYRTQCNNLIIRSHAYNSMGTTNVTGGIDSSTLNNGFGEYWSYASYDPFGSSFPQNVYLNDTNYLYVRYGNYNRFQGCDTLISTFTVKGRPGVEYPFIPGYGYFGGNTLPTTMYGTVLSHNDLGNGDLEITVKHGTNYYLGFLKIPFKVNCTYFASDPYCEIADSLKFSFINTRKCSTCVSSCSDTVNVGEQTFYTNVLNPPSNPCGISFSDVVIDSLNIERINYGWTDSTKVTKANASNGNGTRAMVGDSVSFYASAKVYSGIHDSLIFQFKVYDINRQYTFLSSLLTVYDASAASTYTINASNIIYNTTNYTVRVVYYFSPSLEVGDSLVFNNSAFVTRGQQSASLPLNDLSNDIYADLYYNNGTPGFEKCISQSQKFLFYSNVLGKSVLISTQDMCDNISAMYTVGYFTTYGMERFPNEYREVMSFDSLKIQLEDHFDLDNSRPIGFYNRMADRYTGTPIISGNYNYDSVTKTLTIINNGGVYEAADINNAAYYKGQTIGQIGINVPIIVNCAYTPNPNSINPAYIDFYGDIDLHSDSLARKIHIRKDSSISGYNPSHYPIDIGSRPNLIRYGLNSFIKNQYASNYGATLQLDVTNNSQDISGTPIIGSKYFYITILDTNEMLEITGVTDNLLNSYAKYYRLNDSAWIIEIDSMQINQNLVFNIDVNYKICSNEVITVALGWQCSSYPTQVVGECTNSPSATFLANLGLAGIATTIINQPTGPQNLCDTLTYDIILTNTNVGAADSLNFKYYLPSSGSVVVHSLVATLDSTTEIITGIDSTTYISFDLKNQLLDSTTSGIFENNDTIYLRAKLLTVCGAVSEETYAFSTDGRQVCGDYISVSNIETSTPIAFSGVVKTYDATLTAELTNQCELQNYRISFINIGGADSNDTTRLQDSIFIQLPTGTVFNSGSYMDVHNPLPNTTPTLSGNTVKFGLPSGVVDGDSVVFYIGLTMQSDTCNALDSIILTSLQYYSLMCGATVCPTGIVNGQYQHNITKTQADLEIQMSNSTLNLCNDSITTSIAIINNSVRIDSAKNTTVYFAVDSNNNGVYDSTDVLIPSSQLVYSDSIGANDTVYVTHSFLASTYPNEICQLIAIIDTTSCVCNAVNTIDAVSIIDMGIDTLTVCENDSIVITACGGAVTYPSRTYLWREVVPGTLGYLSNPSVLTPTFYPPNLNQDTSFVYVLEVDRGGCIDNDTLIIEVLSAPNSFTVTDSMVCMGSLLQVQVDNPQMGVFYTAWDNATGGTLLDTLPFNLTVNSDTSYYIEATDSLSLCSTTSRVLINLFIDTIAPTILCQDTTVYLSSLGTITIDSSYVDNGSTDNCVLNTLWLSQTSFSCGNIGTQQVTLYGMDNSGNIDSCYANITVLDTVAPIISCTNGNAYLDGAGVITIDTTGLITSLADNCGIDTVYISSSSNTTFTCTEIGTPQSVTIIVEDNSGNIDSCTTIINVLDTISPVAICQNIDVYLDATGVDTLQAMNIDGGSTDNCNLTSIIITDSIFNCSRIGANQIWLYLSDASGNIDSCQATVTVYDTTAPTLICITDQFDTIYGNTCEFIIPDYRTQITIVDDCLDTTTILYSQIPLPGTVIMVSDSEVVNIQITIMDNGGGNQVTCNSNLYLSCIKQLIIPQFISPNGDGKNDFLHIDYIEQYPNNNLRIFNRYGALVYSKNNYDNSWGGELNTNSLSIVSSENILPSGTYFYILDLGVEGVDIQTGYVQIQQ